MEKDLAAEEKIETLRKKAAPKIAREIELYLHELSIPDGKVEFHIDGVAGASGDKGIFKPWSRITTLEESSLGWGISTDNANARLVLSTEPETLIFDEVDAGIGGQTE